MVAIAQRRGFGINFGLHPADPGGLQHPESFRVSGHDPILNTVVNHLDEMTGPVGTTMQITLLGGAAEFLATGRARDVAAARRQGGENGIKTLHHIGLAADHHAVTAFKTPDAAACPDINVVNTTRREFLRAPDVVYVIRVSSINDGIT